MRQELFIRPEPFEFEGVQNSLGYETVEWANGYPAKVREMIFRGAALWPLAMRRAIDAGIRDSTRLANLAFFMHHPERNGRAIDSNEHGANNLIAQWKFFRNAAKNMLQGLSIPSATVGTKGASGSKCNMPSPLSDVSLSLGESALGFCSRTKNRYGVPETVQALLHIAMQWYLKHPDGPIIVVSDISKCGGGKLEPHDSHRMGLDVDLGFRTNMGSECNKGQRVCSGEGKRSKARDYESKWRPLIKELMEIIRSNPYLPVKVIWFKDSELAKFFKHPDGTRLVSTKEKGHDCHLHVRFCVPERIRSRLTLSKVYDTGEERPSYACTSLKMR